jgi:hypothetical protein
VVCMRPDVNTGTFGATPSGRCIAVAPLSLQTQTASDTVKLCTLSALSGRRWSARLGVTPWHLRLCAVLVRARGLDLGKRALIVVSSAREIGSASVVVWTCVPTKLADPSVWCKASYSYPL